MLLGREGKRVLVLQFARAVISFHNVGQLEHEIETLVIRRNSELRGDQRNVLTNGAPRVVSKDGDVLTVVVDMSLVEDFSIDAGQMFLELLPIAAQHRFSLVVCGLRERELKKMRMYEAPLQMAPPDEPLVLTDGSSHRAILCCMGPLDKVSRSSDS